MCSEGAFKQEPSECRWEIGHKAVGILVVPAFLFTQTQTSVFLYSLFQLIVLNTSKEGLVKE